MEHHCQPSQCRETYHCGGDGPVASEKWVPRRPVSDADKAVDMPTVAKVPVISTPHNNMDKVTTHWPRSIDGEIWPKGPPDTD